MKLSTCRSSMLLAAAVALAGCAFASAPIKETSRVVATPTQGEVSVSSRQAASVGQVTPVFVSIANGTEINREVVPSQIFALNDAGERVAPLPPREAARQAGGAGELRAALTSAAAGGMAEGAFGAAIGAAAGAFTGNIGEAAALGGGIGGGLGAVHGAREGQREAHRQAEEQLSALALQRSDVRRNFTVSGYVFFPTGRYSGVEMLLVNSETGDTESVKAPWN